MQANKQEKQTQSQNILEQDPLPSNDKIPKKMMIAKIKCRAWSIVIMPKIIAVILFR